MISALLVGRNSLLGRAVLEACDDEIRLDAVSHDGLGQLDLEAYDVVLNAALDPAYAGSAYSTQHDMDLKVARAVAACRRPHFVMLSTRRVYGLAAPFPATEEAPATPGDSYGANKLVTERAVRDALGERATILRVANVFGFELGRRTFFGIALSALKSDGTIRLDVSPFVRRDFIPLDLFGRAAIAVLKDRPPGLFNLGSGAAFELGRIAIWIIQGYGSGKLIIDAVEERDNFLLDSTKLNEVINYLPQDYSIDWRCRRIGEQLRNA